jgi:hypothetical protein
MVILQASDYILTSRNCSIAMTAEEQRLQDARDLKVNWKRWGPYLAERAWGTVREDYSPDGDAWNYFPHQHARSKAYRWNEDGLGGFCDRQQFICFALSLWNERDPLLKERLFGLSGPEGNHGEDVKECYYYLDNTPSHSYMKLLYKYPQARFPYEQLLEENHRRERDQPEFELVDTGVFAENRYFDVFVEYAKAEWDDILIRISVINRGPEAAPLRVLPTIWFRNTWDWGYDPRQPELSIAGAGPEGCLSFALNHHYHGARFLHCEGSPEPLFTNNETNYARLYGRPNLSPFLKDGINDYVVDGHIQAVNPELKGTKAAAHYRLALDPGQTVTLRLRFASSQPNSQPHFGSDFDSVFSSRIAEADEFYATVIPDRVSADSRNVMRQALAGLLWSKQFYHYVVKQWIEGDPVFPPPPPQRKSGRNHSWVHLYNSEVISMPDKWEYPWYASWDLAFHCIPMSLVDADFAKQQLVLLLREWYMHPNGQVPAYEWAFGDVNPPVHAWAARRVYQIEQRLTGIGDVQFLERVFHKLLLNFTWWVNRKDANDNNVFEGGFLGLDNIGVFDRNTPLPDGSYVEQSDGTSWMCMYCLDMLNIALELARFNPVYEDVASKFIEHFVYIAEAINTIGGHGLWDEDDGFYYDVLTRNDGEHTTIKVRSMVGLIPLLAVTTFEHEAVDQFPGFAHRMDWFIENRPELTENFAWRDLPGGGRRGLVAIVNPDRLRRILARMLDENEFLSPYGLRALSRYHADHPYHIDLAGETHWVDYEPAESTTGLFGGNSNWRGPVWFPLNYHIIEALQKYHYFLGDDFKVELPTGSGRMCNLWEVATELSRRLISLFVRGENGNRPVYGTNDMFQNDPHWRDLILFHEYFHGDHGAGLGASHQTGWTAVVAKLIEQSG